MQAIPVMQVTTCYGILYCTKALACAQNQRKKLQTNSTPMGTLSRYALETGILMEVPYLDLDPYPDQHVNCCADV